MYDLSIRRTGLQFRPPMKDNDIIASGKMLISELIAVGNDALIRNMKIFKSDTCAICLETDVDTVLCQCGHQCYHYNCVAAQNKCPVCRTHISAVIKI